MRDSSAKPVRIRMQQEALVYLERDQQQKPGINAPSSHDRPKRDDWHLSTVGNFPNSGSSKLSAVQRHAISPFRVVLRAMLFTLLTRFCGTAPERPSPIDGDPLLAFTVNIKGRRGWEIGERKTRKLNGTLLPIYSCDCSSHPNDSLLLFNIC